MADLNELVNLGMRSSQLGDSDAAQVYFRQAVEIDPNYFPAKYLLAAELASAGQFEEARLAFEQTLREHPEQAACRFQTGLLQLTMDMVDQAQATLAPLQQLPLEHYLRFFGEAISALGADDLVRAEDCFRAGLAANSENPPLSGDMAKLLRKVVLLRASRISPSTVSVKTPTAVMDESVPETSASMAFLLGTLHGGRNRH